jgi:hypothetical protein
MLTWVHDTCLHSGGDADSLDRLAAFATKHGLAASIASIAALSHEVKLAAFGDMLRASKKVQALEEAGKRIESIQHLKDLGDAASFDRLAAFAKKHGLAASIAALSHEAKLAAFSNMLAASKQLKVLEARGERVRDVKHLEDIARPAQSAGGQSGSARQTRNITPRGIWDEYVIVIGKEPLSPTSPTNPLLVNLQDVIGQDDIEAFSDGVVVQLGKLTDWCNTRFADLQIEGRASAGQIRASISSTVSEDLGPTLKTDDLTEMVRRIQERDTEWRHKNRSEFPGPTRGARESQYKSYVRGSYRDLVKGMQLTIIEKLALIERVGVVVQTLLAWYEHSVKRR